MIPFAFPNVNPLIVKEQITATCGPILDPVFTDCRHQEHKPLPGAAHIPTTPTQLHTRAHYGNNCPRAAAKRKTVVDRVKMPLLYDVSPPLTLSATQNYDSTHL